MAPIRRPRVGVSYGYAWVRFNKLLRVHSPLEVGLVFRMRVKKKIGASFPLAVPRATTRCGWLTAAKFEPRHPSNDSRNRYLFRVWPDATCGMYDTGCVLDRNCDSKPVGWMVSRSVASEAGWYHDINWGRRKPSWVWWIHWLRSQPQFDLSDRVGNCPSKSDCHSVYSVIIMKRNVVDTVECCVVSLLLLSNSNEII